MSWSPGHGALGLGGLCCLAWRLGPHDEQVTAEGSSGCLLGALGEAPGALLTSAGPGDRH